MVSRVVLLISLCQALGIPWFLEQPINSTMQLHPRFQQLLRWFRIFRKSLHMGDHGGESRKGSWLYSPFEWFAELDIYANRPYGVVSKPDISRAYTDGNGKKRFTGGPDLKASHAYPAEFGQHIQRLFQRHERDLELWAASIEQRALSEDWSIGQLDEEVDGWTDADIGPVSRWFLDAQA